MDNPSDNWQEASTTPAQRATRWVAAVLIVSVLVVAAATVAIYTADQKAKPAAVPTRLASVPTPGIVRVLGMPITITPPATQTALPAAPTATTPATVAATEPATEPVTVTTVTPATTGSSPDTAVGSVVAFSGGAINIRGGPGLNFAVVAILSPSQQAAVLAQSGDGNWWRVSLNGTLGWLRKDTVKFSGNKNNVPVAWAAQPTVANAGGPTTNPTTGAGR